MNSILAQRTNIFGPGVPTTSHVAISILPLFVKLISILNLSCDIDIYPIYDIDIDAIWISHNDAVF
jgi:hypothetical protein